MNSAVRKLSLLVCALPLFAATALASPVASGLNHTVVVDSSGAVWTFGRNNSGQLGNGGTTDSALPIQVSHLPLA